MSAYEIQIPHGDPGIDRTLREMKRLALAAAKDPVVIDWAHGIVRYVPERDADAEAGAFLAWVRRNTRYTHDPVSVELVKKPRRMIEEWQKHGTIVADCDDQVTLLAAGLEVVGVPTRFVVVAAQPGANEYSHVLIEYQSPKRGWTSMDPIVRGTGLGWFPPSYSRVGRLGDLGGQPNASTSGLLIPILALAGLWFFFKRRK